MKRNRLLLFVAWIISIVIISFYGGPISYGLFAVLTITPVLSLAYIYVVFFTYRIYQKIETNSVVADHTVNYYFTLQNETPFLFSGIKVGFYSSFSEIVGLNSDVEYELTPQNGLRIDTELVCKYRGEYKVGVKNVVIQDPFRLFCLSFKNPEPLSTKVKPNLITLDNLQAGDRLVEMKKENRNDKNENDAIVRNYVPGDSLKKVNWKTSAKMGEIMVRKDTGEEKGRIRLVLDTYRESEEEAEYLPLENKELETVLALALYYVKKNIPVTLSYTQGKIENIHLDTLGKFEEFYNKVSEIRFDSDYTPDSLLKDILCDNESRTSMATVLVFHKWNNAFINASVLLVDMDNAVDVYLVSDSEDEIIQNIAKIRQILIPINKKLEEVL